MTVENKKRGRPIGKNPMSPAQKQRAYRDRLRSASNSLMSFDVYRQFMESEIRERESFYYIAQHVDKQALMNEINVLVLFDMRFKNHVKAF